MVAKPGGLRLQTRNVVTRVVEPQSAGRQRHRPKLPALQVTPSPVRSDPEIERTVSAFASAPGGGLIVMPDAFTNTHSARIIELCAEHRLPAIYAYRFQAVGGGLIAYGVDLADSLRSAAGYVDRILKGEKPANLPVQVPTKFLLVINLNTAKALGLAVPDKLLALADEAIE
jgi:putative tryptophan/tyrosine transport system substrate-binding protein